MCINVKIIALLSLEYVQKNILEAVNVKLRTTFPKGLTLHKLLSGGCYENQLLFKILQHPQENIRGGVLFSEVLECWSATLLKKDNVSSVLVMKFFIPAIQQISYEQLFLLLDFAQYLHRFSCKTVLKSGDVILLLTILNANTKMSRE